MIRNIAKNIVALNLNGGIRILFGLIAQVLIGRFMGAENLGKFAVMTAYIAIFQVLMQLGLPPLLIRETARHRERVTAYWWTGTATLVLLGSIAWGAQTLVATLWGHPSDTYKMVVISGMSLIPFGLVITSEAVLRGLERMEILPIVQTVAYFMYTSALLLVVFTHASVVMFGWAMVLLQCVAAVLYAGYFLFTHVIARVEIRTQLAHRLMRQAFHFYGPSIAGVVPDRITIIIVAKILGESAGGIFNVAQVLTRALFFFATGYAEALYPALSRLFLMGKEKFRTGVRFSLQYALVFSATLSLVMMAWAPWLVEWIFGREEYAQAIPVLQILAWQTVLFELNSVMSLVEMAANRQDTAFYIAMFRVLAFLIIIPITTLLGGLMGTTIGILASIGLATVWHMWTVHRITGALPSLAFWCRAVVVLILSISAVYFGPKTSLWGILFVSLSAYIGGMVLFGIIRRQDIRMIQAGLLQKTYPLGRKRL